MREIDALFFDLDGTLVDTAPDLAYALNRVLEEEGRAGLDFAQIRHVASDGSAGLLALGFGIDAEDADFSRLQQRLIDIYRDNLTRASTLFDGMDAVIDELDRRGTPWGVITNKPAFLTEPLLAGLALSARAACIVSGDTTPRSKPHPEPMLHACRLTGANPHRCFYVGDARRDIEAGRQAHMHTIAAAYGYLAQHEDPASWMADAIIFHPSELTRWL